jgi:hypothetical protein
MSATCFKCGAEAYARWRVCADDEERWVCLFHDIELNRIGLTWAYGRRRASEMMMRYVAKVLGVGGHG